jgi:hypothetical protein
MSFIPPPSSFALLPRPSPLPTLTPPSFFIVQTTGKFKVGSAANVILINGAKAEVIDSHNICTQYTHYPPDLSLTHMNIQHACTHTHKHTHTQKVFWQVAGATSIGTSADVKGVILSKTNVDFKIKSALNGRILAQTAVTLDAVTIDSRTTA